MRNVLKQGNLTVHGALKSLLANDLQSYQPQEG